MELTALQKLHVLRNRQPPRTTRVWRPVPARKTDHAFTPAETQAGHALVVRRQRLANEYLRQLRPAILGHADTSSSWGVALIEEAWA